VISLESSLILFTKGSMVVILKTTHRNCLRASQTRSSQRWEEVDEWALGLAVSGKRREI
jgi:hypothetical protein